jgi:hypothetical protein
VSFGVKSQPDNGRFQNVAFRNTANRKINYFWGVNTHFQYGWSEHKIRNLQDGARTAILHASKKFPDVITINLWPYALRYANYVGNTYPQKGKKISH